MKTFDLLASLDFGKIISESIASNKTQTGREFLEKYSAITMSNPVTCGLVNRFMTEAKNYLYDTAIYEAVEKINETLDKNKISWALATVCENINSNNSKYNYLNRQCADHVMTLLEGRTEQEVVAYIKAGALKNDMFCEGIRNVVKSVYKDQAVIIENAGYTLVHPVSYVEVNEGKTYFSLGNRTFNMDAECNLYEVHQGERTGLTPKFSFINETLNRMTFDGKETFGYVFRGIKDVEYQISESNQITKIYDGEEETMTVEAFRDNNRRYLMTVNPAKRNEVARMLEGLAQVAENYDNIVLVEEVSYVTTSRGKQFMIIEGQDCVNFTLMYSPTQKPFTKNYISIVECLNDIKNMCQLDLTSIYESRINEEFEKKNASEQKKVQESLENASIQSRREKIAMLTEAYKNDPATLAVLSRIALELNNINE